MPRRILLAVCAILVFTSSARADGPPKLGLKSGDRVVFLGNAFAERDQSYGYFETLLTAGHPEVDFTFRNLGWSGDTVWGDARARFGTRADGFAHLRDHVLALKPTIIFVAYGLNESFDGEAGMKGFEAGMNTLLDTLAVTKARLFLITPMRLENLGPPLPDPAVQNGKLRLYRDVMAKIAATRGIGLVDLIDSLEELNEVPRWNLTDDGLHLTARGSALVMNGVASLLDGTIGPGMLDGLIGPRMLRVDAAGGVGESLGWRSIASHQGEKDFKYVGLGDTLPGPPWPVAPAVGAAGLYAGGGGIKLRIEGLPKGRYTLKIDGVTTNRLTADGGRCEMEITAGSEIDQVEKLRKLINKKNELYFHRWRPQNETYLFGFRKHEQGNNAVEIPQFDPLIAELEVQINTLKKPVKHTYELIREGANK